MRTSVGLTPEFTGRSFVEDCLHVRTSSLTSLMLNDRFVKIAKCMRLYQNLAISQSISNTGVNF